MLLYALYFNKGCVNIWIRIVGDYLTGLYMRENFYRIKNADFLKRTLPLLFEDVHLNIHESRWFQHKHASPHVL
jgi:hypothetical protein